MSEADKVLHDQILDLRDQFLAHSDLTIKEAKLYLEEVAGQRLPFIVSNTDPLLPGSTEVKKLIERSVTALFNEIEEYQKRFNSSASD